MKNILILIISASILNATFATANDTLHYNASQMSVEARCFFSQELVRSEDGICRCKEGDFPILSPHDFEECVSTTQNKAACLSRGTHIARYYADEIVDRGVKASCLCVATGRFMGEFQGGSGFTDAEQGPALDACEQAYTSVKAWSEEDRNARLNHYLSGLPNDVTPLVDITSSQSIASFLDPSNSARTVKIVGKRKGLHGGIVFVFRQNFDNRRWFDSTDPVGQQGDPSHAAIGLGPVIGPFFGYEKIDDDTYTSPSLDEFARAIDAINKKETIVAGGALRVSGQFGALEYNLHFIQDGRLPGSEFLDNGDQTYFFHDISLHLASLILYPPELYNALRSNVSRVWLIIEKSIDATNAPAAIKREMKKKISEGLVTLVDGVSVQALQARFENSTSSTQKDHFERLEHFPFWIAYKMQPEDIGLGSIGSDYMDEYKQHLNETAKGFVIAAPTRTGASMMVEHIRKLKETILAYRAQVGLALK